MKTSEIKFYTKRELSLAQQQRLADHKASVFYNPDGTLNTTVKSIITPNGLVKEVEYKSIKPGTTERVMKVSDAGQLFEDLQHINLILTNACNLSCSYCYEQHNKDYGRFTPDSLKQVYDFQLNANQNEGKLFQFFGGEPLIHKQLILDFIEKYHHTLSLNLNSIHVSMITNGILLTPDFISSYFAHKFVNMSISLDTIKAEVDHREIGQSKIDHILDMISLIPEYHKLNHMVSIRCTIAMENAPYLLGFAKELYKRGLRTMVIHPLTMSSVNGFMSWDADQWEQLHQDIKEIITTFPGFEVQFSEGVGVKGGSNCMVGSDMIAVDGSGDYSGCYFFTNQKEAAPHTILGNLLDDRVYVDRYMQFQSMYNEMFITEAQCKSCDLKGFCYQCPAGNSDSGRGQLFRPDDMCQKIVRLFIDLQNDIVRKSFMQKFTQITETVEREGEQRVFAKAITHLMYKHVTGTHLPVGDFDHVLDKFPQYQQILGYFKTLIHTGKTDLPCGCNHFDQFIGPCVEIKDFYEFIMEHQGKPAQASKRQEVDDIGKRIFYLTMLHMVFLNKKGDDLDKPIKYIKL